jgi:hypothetical protein
MKKYIKPNLEVMNVKVQPLMGNSVTTASGLDDVTISSSDFGGGAADSRCNSWDDEEED